MTVNGQWFSEVTSEDQRHRRDLRERAIYAATLLHTDTGDAMVVLDRESAARDVIATAREFFDFIVGESE